MSEPANVQADHVPVPRPAVWDPVEAIRFGWRAVTGDLMIVVHLVVAGLIANAFPLVVTLIAAAAGVRSDDLQAVRGVAQLVNFPFATWMGMGIVRYVLAVTRGQPAGFGEIFGGGPFWSFLGASIVYGLLVIAGLVFCIVPGIFVGIALQFFSQEIVDRGRPALQSLQDSWDLTMGHKWSLVAFGVLALLVNIAGLLACGVGILLTSSLTTVSSTWIYLRLRGEVPPAR